MSRNSRKKFEKIHLRRAKEGFPPVSKAILHRDGSISPRPPQPYNIIRSANFNQNYAKLSPDTQTKVDQALAKLARNPYASTPINASTLDRLLNKLQWLKQELKLLSKRIRHHAAH